MPTRAVSGSSRMRRPGRIERRTRQQAAADEIHPVDAAARRHTSLRDHCLEAVDLVERLELEEAALGGAAQPRLVGPRICCHSSRAELRSRALSIAAASGRSQMGAPGWAPARWNQVAAVIGSWRCQKCTNAMSWKCCLLRLGGNPLLEEGDRLIGAAGAARGRLAQEDGAEAIGDGEEGIQSGREIEQRLEELVLAATAAREAIAAVVLDGPDPVDVGRKRVELERHALHRRAGAGVEELLAFGSARRVGGIATGHSLTASASASAATTGRSRRTAVT